ncbi:hypothetical protein F443_21978 [Phytophthora nicotianae P1569]|nr:hypothetical protein F443_21978 [Phytophthora nicotianae P1569]
MRCVEQPPIGVDPFGTVSIGESWRRAPQRCSLRTFGIVYSVVVVIPSFRTAAGRRSLQTCAATTARVVMVNSNDCGFHPFVTLHIASESVTGDGYD